MRKLDKTEEKLYTLEHTQEWFGNVISGPLGQEDSISKIAPGGGLIAEEAGRYLVSNSKLAPYQRIEIYNQQYWWRLLKTLHTNFPLVTRLFGYQAFNEEIAVPYLNRYPPNHWSITLIGERLPGWIAENYKKPDLPFIQNAASLDWAFTASFVAPSYPPLDLKLLVQDPEALLETTLFLQPFVTPFHWEYNLLDFREQFLKEEVEHWLEHPFPTLKKGDSLFILYRTLDNLHAWREVSQGEFFFLGLFKNGCSVSQACEIIEQQKEALYEEVSANLPKIIETWVRLGWLTKSKNNP